MDEHTPVLFDKALELLNINPDKNYIDATIGRGGHAAGILEKLERGEGRLIGIDKDKKAIEYCKNNLPDGKLKLYHSSYTRIPEIIKSEQIDSVAGVLFDLGVSSPQLDNADRGFSYRQEAYLDMRMNRDQELTAAEIINNSSRQELERIIKKYGEERWAARIVDFIVKRREKEKITTTKQLVNLIKDAIPASARRKGGHPARRTFQAIRIATNRELDELEEVLDSIPGFLEKNGRICVISFHSLEDRIVKNKFKEHAKECVCPPDFPICGCDKVKQLKILTKTPLRAESEEKSENPRARSAKLRAAEKI